MCPLPSDRGHSPRAGRSPLSSLLSRDRRSALELPEPDRRGARAPHQADYRGNPSTPRALGPCLASPVLAVRFPETRPTYVAPPVGVAPSSRHEVAPALTRPRPSSLRPSPAFTLSGRALDFRALLRVWFGCDPAPLPTRDRPVLPWVSSSPPRHSELFATRSPWPASSARAAEWWFVDADTYDSP